MREVGYLNFEFDYLVDDIVANLPLQKHILSHWRRIDDSRFNIAKLNFSQLSNNSQHNEEGIDLLRCNIAESFGENYLTLLKMYLFHCYMFLEGETVLVSIFSFTFREYCDVIDRNRDTLLSSIFRWNLTDLRQWQRKCKG